MPIQNQKGLEALRALSEGGSPALQAYQSAQGNEAASRTTALKTALGGQDVGAAAAAAQAKYSPKVPTSGLGVGDLGAAADSYLSRASNKLAAQNYEDQQNLTLQGESLRRQQVSEQDRELMLRGAADAMAEEQRSQIEGDAAIGGELGALGQQKADLRNQLTALDQLNNAQPNALAPVFGPTKAMQDLQALAASGNVGEAQRAEYVRMMQELVASGRDKEVVGQGPNQDVGADQGLLGSAQRVTNEANPDRRGEILRAMAGLDQQYEAAAGKYAGFLGTDAAGLMDRYKQADTGNAAAVRAFLGEEGMKGMAEGALGARNRAVDMGEQGRLRELAPAFGINSAVAAGKFREGEGTDLQRQGKLQSEEDYITGAPSKAAKANADKAGAQATGLELGDYVGIKESLGMSDEDIVGTVQSDDWGPISEIANEYVGKDRTKKTGVAGFRKDVSEKIKDLVDTNGKPVPDADKRKMIDLAVAYYSGQIVGSKSEAETE